MKSKIDIIDALERAIKRAEYVCSNYCDDIEVSTIKDAVDLIKHQDAEINDLKADKEALINGQLTLQKNLPKVVRAGAIKEFAERLREIYKKHLVCSFNVLNNEIDNLVIEMTTTDTSVSLVDGHIED